MHTPVPKHWRLSKHVIVGIGTVVSLAVLVWVVLGLVSPAWWPFGLLGQSATTCRGPANTVVPGRCELMDQVMARNGVEVSSKSGVAIVRFPLPAETRQYPHITLQTVLSELGTPEVAYAFHVHSDVLEQAVVLEYPASGLRVVGYSSGGSDIDLNAYLQASPFIHVSGDFRVWEIWYFSPRSLEDVLRLPMEYHVLDSICILARPRFQGLESVPMVDSCIVGKAAPW